MCNTQAKKPNICLYIAIYTYHICIWKYIHTYVWYIYIYTCVCVLQRLLFQDTSPSMASTHPINQPENRYPAHLALQLNGQANMQKDIKMWICRPWFFHRGFSQCRQKTVPQEGTVFSACLATNNHAEKGANLKPPMFCLPCCLVEVIQWLLRENHPIPGLSPWFSIDSLVAKHWWRSLAA